MSLTPSFGARWLIPRLPRFRAAHPGIEVIPVAENRLVDLPREGFDMAVRYSAVDHVADGAEAVPWLREELVPIAAPELLADLPRTPDGLERAKILAFPHHQVNKGDQPTLAGTRHKHRHPCT